MTLRIRGTTLAAVLATTTIAVETSGKERDRTLDERLTFLEGRIATQRTHAQIWWWGFTSFYVVGAVVQGARAAVAVERVDQADLWVSAVKASGGALRYLIDPYGGIEGFDAAHRPLTRAQKRARIRLGEQVLLHNADTTHPFGPWYAHLINIGINGVGFVIVGAGFDGWKEGAISGGIGVAVGTLAILTSPWEADDDLEEYSAKYGDPGDGNGEKLPDDSGFRWRFQPAPGGLGWNASF